MRLETQVAVLRERLDNADRNLVKQAAEYARRLHGLNNSYKREAERLGEMQATYTPRVLFDMRIDELRRDLLALKEYKDQMVGRMSVIAVVASTLTTVLLLYAKEFL